MLFWFGTGVSGEHNFNIELSPLNKISFYTIAHILALKFKKRLIIMNLLPDIN